MSSTTTTKKKAWNRECAGPFLLCFPPLSHERTWRKSSQAKQKLPNQEKGMQLCFSLTFDSYSLNSFWKNREQPTCFLLFLFLLRPPTPLPPPPSPLFPQLLNVASSPTDQVSIMKLWQTEQKNRGDEKRMAPFALCYSSTECTTNIATPLD